MEPSHVFKYIFHDDTSNDPPYNVTIRKPSFFFLFGLFRLFHLRIVGDSILIRHNDLLYTLKAHKCFSGFIFQLFFKPRNVIWII